MKSLTSERSLPELDKAAETAALTEADVAETGIVVVVVALLGLLV